MIGLRWFLGFVLFTCIRGTIDSRENFCGRKLSYIMRDLCAVYNYLPQENGRVRRRRQIVKECCRSQCTRRYILQNYCNEVNRDKIELMLTLPQNINKTDDHFNIEKWSDNNFQSDRDKTEEINRNKDPSSVNGQSSKLNKSRITADKEENKDIIGRRGKRNNYNNNKCRGRRRSRRPKRRRNGRKLRRTRVRQQAPPPKVGHIKDSQAPFYILYGNSIV